MDFIERAFGASPDAGSGTYEMLLLVALLASVALWMRRRISDGRT
jgi:hypothetical protein